MDMDDHDARRFEEVETDRERESSMQKKRHYSRREHYDERRQKLEKRKDKGVCFKNGEKWGKEYRCKTGKLFMIDDTNEDKDRLNLGDASSGDDTAKFTLEDKSSLDAKGNDEGQGLDIMRWQGGQKEGEEMFGSSNSSCLWNIPRKDKGVCFKNGEKWGKEYRCKTGKLFMIDDTNEDKDRLNLGDASSGDDTAKFTLEDKSSLDAKGNDEGLIRRSMRLVEKEMDM
ncbi:hypothetical protein CJ030_MR7G011663 [Morella rubra]|uniref:Uncharacterized protein n=1 Tax=Morella rubra TaxID=262757 RepID=A0A6A1V4D5_9ROSI|nr:hypothetical protein CJ030_MR7G011663 [Morella rubra]